MVNVTTGAETPAVIQYDFRRIARGGGAAGGGGAGELAAARWVGSGDGCSCEPLALFPPLGVATPCCHAGRFRLGSKAQQLLFHRCGFGQTDRQRGRRPPRRPR